MSALRKAAPLRAVSEHDAFSLDALRRSTRNVLNATEAAPYLGLDPRTVRRGCEAGEIPSFKIGGRVLIPREALLRLLETGASDFPPLPSAL